MIRTQVQLTEDQAARLKAAAARRGVSMSELIRQGVDAILAPGAPSSPDAVWRRAGEAAGKFHSGKHDVSSRHDAYLAEDFST